MKKSEAFAALGAPPVGKKPAPPPLSRPVRGTMRGKLFGGTIRRGLGSPGAQNAGFAAEAAAAVRARASKQDGADQVGGIAAGIPVAGGDADADKASPSKRRTGAAKLLAKKKRSQAGLKASPAGSSS